MIYRTIAVNEMAFVILIKGESSFFLYKSRGLARLKQSRA